MVFLVVSAFGQSRDLVKLSRSDIMYSNDRLCESLEFGAKCVQLMNDCTFEHRMYDSIIINRLTSTVFKYIGYGHWKCNSRIVFTTIDRDLEYRDLKRV